MKDLSQIEPTLVDLIYLALYMLLGEQDKDWWLYEINEERVPLLNLLHQN